MRFHLFCIGIAALAGGCSAGEISTGRRVLPLRENLIFQTFLTHFDVTGRLTSKAAENAQEVEVAPDSVSTFAPGRGGGSIPLRPDGTVDVGAMNERVWGSEILEYLPPPEQAIRVRGESWRTTIDDEAVTAKPIAAWKTEAGLVVRVETLAVVHRGVADLLEAPDAGWRLLRAYRLDAQALDRRSDLVCLSASDKISHPALASALADSHGYDEFDVCTGGEL